MTELQAHVDLGARTVRAGTAYVAVTRGRVSTTFVYDASYLSETDGYDLEPGLPRQAGQQYVDGLPGCFSDCAPDRWGRNLIDKQRRVLQRDSAQRLPGATEIDHLLGVSDVTRQGNLRFSQDDGPFPAPGDGVPELVSLPRLLAAADSVVDGSDTDDLTAVKALLEAGSGSLGGARPKASVRGDDGALLLAKFPHPGDEWDVMAWEKTMLDLARSAGLRAPLSRLAPVGRRRVLLVDRFDRGPGGRRLGYVSAMTMLEARDGDARDYGDIAEAVVESGSGVKGDLLELFARVVFSVAVHNTDDHLRNHGFLRQRGGWSLSPLFDVNPHPDVGRRRATSVLGAADVSGEVEALLDFGVECRLRPEVVREVVRRVVVVVGSWRSVAAANGVDRSELAVFSDVFDTQLTALTALAG